MTGEMSQFDAEHGEEWALHRKIAKALKGKIHAFDVYQGPWIQPPEGGRLWIACADDEGWAYRFHYTRQGYPDQIGERFMPHEIRRACRLARRIVALRP
jgi:hypothetical protein